MTKPFSPAQKYRILVNFGARVIVGDNLVTVWAATSGLSETKRFHQLRALDRAGTPVIVKCACGCETWERLSRIEFDHKKAHVNGGATVIANGQPLRTHPCHRAVKCAGEQAVTGWVTRVRNAHAVAPKPEPGELTRVRGRVWPRRPFPKSQRRIPSRPFPKKFEART